MSKRELVFCRLCAETDPTVDFVDIGSIRMPPTFIQHYLLNSYPLEKPAKICKMCAANLLNWHTFIAKVRRVQELLTHAEKSTGPLTQSVIAWIKENTYQESKHLKNDNTQHTLALKRTDEDSQADWGVGNGDEVKSPTDFTLLNPMISKNTSVIITNNSFIMFECHLCKEKFNNWCALGNHTTRQHRQKPKVLCLCNQYLHTRSAINRHIAKHDTNSHISCPKCGKVCLSQKYLQAHILSHNSDEGPRHSCDDCGRIFSAVSNLKAHKRTHLPAQEKFLFTCTVCPKKLTTKSAWKNHIASVHEKKKPYICDICGITFAHKTNLAYHLRSHGEIFAYSCTVCPKSFKNKIKLVRHTRTHSSNTHQCTICAKLLKTKHSLDMHMSTHCAEPVVICYVCDKTYKKKASLQVFSYFDKYTFTCDWYEEDADKIRELCLHFFPYDNSVQVIDVGRQKRFVNRVMCPDLKAEMLQIGATINLFSRLLYIKDCASATRVQLFPNYESTFALIKPMPASEYGKIFTFILKNGFRIVRLKKGNVNKDFTLIMYRRISNHPKLPIIIDYVTSGEVIGMELVAENAIKKWRKCIGLREPSEAEPGTLRRMYGESIVKNIVHGADDAEDVKTCLDYFFGTSNKILKIPLKASFKNCTCCIVKPHAIVDGNLGNITNMITAAKFKISAMAMFTLDTVNAEEFYEVYKNVVPEFKEMAAQLALGQFVAMEILGEDPDKECVSQFRELCGPRDPDVCRQLYPDSIRAHYGRDVVRNAVHCTDLVEDGPFEVEYFFKILAQTTLTKN